MRKNKGFTLIEVIGVMVILAILASAVAPNIIKRIENARNDAEDIALNDLADSFENAFLINREIPNNANFPDFVLPYYQGLASDISAAGNGSRVLRINNTDLQHPYDQEFRFGNGNDPEGQLPTTRPEPQIILVSNLDENVPNTNLDDDDFLNVWNQTGVIPDGFTDEDPIHIMRVPLQKYFYQVSVINNSPDVKNWSIDSSTRDREIDPGEIFMVFLIKGTNILLKDNSATPVTESAVIVNDGINIEVDASGVWSW
jgi:prepilin-type N-terminal cleavage/methylation domain-containing protein